MSASLESYALLLQRSGIALELLTPGANEPNEFVGVRLRTFGKKLPPKKMVIARGHTFVEATERAVTDARARNWRTLDWAARPWERFTPEPDEFGVDWSAL